MFERFRRQFWVRFRRDFLGTLSRMQWAIDRRCQLCGRTNGCGECAGFAASVAQRQHPVEAGFYVDELGYARANPGSRRILATELAPNVVLWDLRAKPFGGPIIWADESRGPAEELSPKVKVSVAL